MKPKKLNLDIEFIEPVLNKLKEEKIGKVIDNGYFDITKFWQEIEDAFLIKGLSQEDLGKIFEKEPIIIQKLKNVFFDWLKLELKLL